MRIRIVPLPSGKQVIQVVSKRLGKLTVHKHLGTFVTEAEKQSLLGKARAYIKSEMGQEELFGLSEQLQLKNVVITHSQPLFLYRLLCGVYQKLGFTICPDSLVRDLIVARIYKPASKRETREILLDLFGIQYSLLTIYRHLKKAIGSGLKEQFQTALVDFAQKELHDSLRLVFYDVTTLAFDSQSRGGLKDFGFSKDHRFTDVQIVVGLVVNKQGFPLYFDVFNGRIFEGKTFLSVVLKIKDLLKNPNLVVIADAAMISRLNIDELSKNHIGFIVGARLGNLPGELQRQISQKVLGQDQKTTTVDYLGHRLICQYLWSRAAKDRSDREKQIEKARQIISTPAKISRRFRFVEAANGRYQLNDQLIEKAKTLEGIKGYLTNTDFDQNTVTERYHDLWRIEKAFRMTKSDLEARPIFHRLDETITAHLVIVFASLAVCRYLEIKTGLSIQKILQMAEKVLTHKAFNPQTGENALIETTIVDQDLKEKIDRLNSLGH